MPPTDDSWDSTLSLLTRARAGDEEAANDLFARYVPVLRRWAAGRLPCWARDLADTPDLVQETLVHVFKKIEGFEHRGEGAFHAYLRQAVMNRIRNEVRNAAYRPERVELDEQAPDDRLSPLEAAIGTQAVDRGGQIAGYSYYTLGRAFLWNNGVLTDLGASANVTTVRPDLTATEAHGINASGQVVGHVSYVLSPGIRTTRAALWQNGTMIELAGFGDTTCTLCRKNDTAWTINASGQIVGSAEMPFAHATLWQNGTITDLGTLGGNTSTARPPPR